MSTRLQVQETKPSTPTFSSIPFTSGVLQRDRALGTTTRTAARRQPNTDRQQSAGVGRQTPTGALPAQPGFERDFSGVSVRGTSAEAMQAKLTLGSSKDAYEREADRIADMVLRMAGPGGAETPPIEVSEGSARVQPKAGSEHASTVTPQIEADLSTLRSNGGRPLSGSARAYLEPRFNQDLSALSIHTGPRAETLAHSVEARAFTVGRDIVFGPGEYAPNTQEGRWLLAHEVAHVMQQRALDARTDSSPRTDQEIRRAEPTTSITIGAVAAKCIVGAIAGVLFDSAIQAVLHSISEWTWRFWEASWDYCSMILSAAIGCIAAPVGAATLEPWVASKLGPKLGGMAGTLLGKLLLFVSKKVAVAIPKGMVKALAKLGCISPEQANELGVQQGEPEEPIEPVPAEPEPTTPEPKPTPEPAPSVAGSCQPMSGDVVGERVLMKVNTPDFLNRAEREKFERLSDSLASSRDRVEVHGMASVDGPLAYNERLSCERAITATRRLMDEGVARSQITGVYQHGEVPGPHQRQRSVVLKREPAGPTPEPEPKPKPEPKPTPTAPTPTMTLKSIQFASDHGLMKDNQTNWSGSGELYPEPEWQSADQNGGSAPISHTKGETIQAKVVLDVSLDSVSGELVTLKGDGSESFLSFQTSETLGNGDTQEFAVTSQGKLPDRIDAYMNQSIVWSAEVGKEKRFVGVSTDHSVFATYDTPRDDVTHKRMATATRLTKGFGNKPHDIVSGQMSRFPQYNLDKAFTNPWYVADDIKEAADCQTIVRFVDAVNDQIGLPGKSRGITVYAKPASPTVPEHSSLTPEGGLGMHNLPEQPGTGYRPGLFDPDGNYNNYEAALEFDFGGKKFYPGGVDPPGVGLKAMKEVLYVFEQMAWYRFDEVTRERVPVETIYCYQPPC